MGEEISDREQRYHDLIGQARIYCPEGFIGTLHIGQVRKFISHEL